MLWFKPSIKKIIARGDRDRLVAALRGPVAPGTPMFEVAIHKLVEVAGENTIHDLSQSLEGRRAVDVLLAVLANDTKRTWPKRQAAVCLGQRREKSAVEPLLKALSNGDLQSEVTTALGAIGDDRAIGPIIGLISTNGDYWKFVPLALGSFGARAVARLVERLSAGSAWERERVARVLQALKWQPTSKEEEIALLFAEKNLETMVTRYPETRERIFAVAKDGSEDGELRNRALKALTLSPDDEVIDFLIASLRPVQKGSTAIQLLGRLRVERAVPPLIDVLESFDPRAAESQFPYYYAIDALARIGGPEAHAALTAAKNHSDQGIRLRVAEAMAAGKGQG